MRANALFLSLLFVLAACGSSSGPGMTSVPGHGAISIDVVPNPIVAKPVSGTTYDFPFDVVVRETGGHRVDITRVSVAVFAPGGLNVGEESWDAERIRAMGTSTTIAANSEMRYHFSQRKNVPDERLFNGVYAELRVEGVDDTGTPTSATTRVTITQG
jgi:hypothetical protein